MQGTRGGGNEEGTFEWNAETPDAPNTVLSPTFRAAAEVVGSGEIGKVCAARGRYGSNGPHEPWFYEAGGGSLFDLGVYNVVTLTGLLGPARGVVRVAYAPKCSRSTQSFRASVTYM